MNLKTKLLLALAFVLCASSAQAQTRTQVASDDFNRASLGADWAQLNAIDGNMTIFSSVKVDGSAAGSIPAAARWVGAGSFTDDQYASMAVADFGFFGADYNIGVIARASADTEASRDFYYYRVQDTGSPFTTTLGKIVNGTNTVLGTSTAISWSAGDRIEIEVQGTTIRGLKNGTVQHSATDSALTTGAPGITGSGGGQPTGDNWVGGNLSTGSDPSIIRHRRIIQ